MLGSLIGGAMKIGSTIVGGISSSRARRKVQKNLEQQERDNQNLYEQRYNEDATQRADAQQLLTYTQDAIRNRNKASRGIQAVMGGNNESVVADKAANNAVMTDTVGRISAAADARKDAIEDQYLRNKASIDAQENQLALGNAANIATAAGQMANVGADIASALAPSKS